MKRQQNKGKIHEHNNKTKNRADDKRQIRQQKRETESRSNKAKGQKIYTWTRRWSLTNKATALQAPHWRMKKWRQRGEWKRLKKIGRWNQTQAQTLANKEQTEQEGNEKRNGQ